MAVAKQDIKDFNARVKRIKNPRNHSYYDPDLGMHIPKRVGRDHIKKAKRGDEEGLNLGPVIVSMIVGAFALMIAQVVRIRYFGDTGSTNVTLTIELFLAFWTLLILTALMNRRTVGARIAQFIGVGAMLVAGHNLIWRWPEPMAMIYTQEYVDEVMATTTQHSVVVAGTVFGF